MSTGPDRKVDTERVRQSLLNNLQVHVRLTDQGHDPSPEELNQLVELLPDLSAFSEESFHNVRIVLDWDHQIPSQFLLLRVFCCYDDRATARLNAIFDDRDAEIDETNLYPEFDVPDYGEIEASETYVAVMRPGSSEFEDFRFLSTWRKQVEPKTADRAVRTVRGYEGYKKAAAARASDGLGGPVVIGWAPPCLAESDSWAIEIWLLTEFDGHAGKARVFMVDIESAEITREFDTDVQLA